MSRSRLVHLVPFLLLLAPPLSADEAVPEEVTPPERVQIEATPEPPPEVVTPESMDDAPLLHGRLQLSLEDAIRMGLENNLNVQVERYSPIIAGYDEDIAWGAFDPELFGEFGYLDSKTPNANAIFSSDTMEVIDTSTVRTTDGTTGLRGILPVLGTEYSASWDGSRTKTSVNIEALSPEYESGWSVNLTQPILRDLIWNQPWTQVRTTRLLSDSSEEGFRQSTMDTVRDIETAYWTLVANDEAQKVARKSLETAKALLDQTQTQYDVGVVSKVEVTEAEAGLSQREVNLIRAENTYRNQQDVLINLVLGPGLRSNSTLEISASDRPDDFKPYEVDVEAAVNNAFQNRPEIVSAEREIERQEVQLQFAKNQRLPELDGIFSIAQAGIGGKATCIGFDGTPDPACLANPFRSDFDDTTDGYSDNPVYSARARLSIPFPNTAARKTTDKTEIELRRARTRKRRLEQDIIIEVRKSARDLRASQEAIVAAQAAERAASEQLRAERIRLEYGESTPFDVLQREEDLVDRENELISAFQAWRNSSVSLDRAQGTILRNRSIAIGEVRRLR
jgi:outer membrane protein TolC